VSSNLNPADETRRTQPHDRDEAATSSAESYAEKGWHALDCEAVGRELNSSESGLTSDEAGQRLARYGLNRLPERAGTSAWMRLLLQFHNPLIYVLLVTSVATGLLGHWVDTGVILGVVILNAIIGFIQEARAEQAIASLKQMLSPQAMVLRDGAKTGLDAAELVPGDVVFIQSGDKIPADVRLFQLKNLQADEAALTGESLPVDKQIQSLPGDAPLAEWSNMAFAGTLVTTGSGTGIVVATGEHTQIGRIADMLGEVEGVDTPLIRRLARFSKVITITIVLFCVAIFVAGKAAGQPTLTMLMSAVALAVSAIPEGLPAIMTIALAIGVKRMARRNAVVRKLPAVEALGSTTIICTDKTGTLTRNEMTVTRLVLPEGQLSVGGAGYDPTGLVEDESGASVSLDDSQALAELVRAATLCNDSSLSKRDGQWVIDGDPTEGALLVLAGKLGLQPDEAARNCPRTDLIPFESELQYMATLHHDHADHAWVFLKGSPEAVLSRCSGEFGRDDAFDAQTWHEITAQMAADGQRVLAIAMKEHPAHDVVLESDDVEGGFLLLGLVGMIDPPRQEAIEAITKCHAAGIRVKMITGDHVATARAIGRQIGISNGDGAMTGVELDRLDDAAFDRAVLETDVFARVSPAHKLKFVQSLQRQGHIVAMTGDGVNDAPALKQADIGVAMGITGTEVSKEAAEMVLLDDNFASIERAVEEGRTVFNNLKKTILFILPTNGGECVTLVAALLLGTLLPILPLHILWINLVTTVALAISLAFDPVDHDVMHQAPRDPRAALIDRPLIWRILYVSGLMALGTFGLFFYELSSGASLEAARAVAVNAIVFFEVAYLFNSRHLTDSVINRRGFFGNPIVWWGIAAVAVFQAVFTCWPVSHRLFEIDLPGLGSWLRVLLSAGALFLLVEIEKALSRCLSQNPDTPR
jgi:magnesium-transporting ATPase (P-type)